MTNLGPPEFRWPARDRSSFSGSDQASPPILIVPGLHNSGPAHWQRLWLRRWPAAEVVEQADWDRPQLDDWINRLEAAVRRHPGAVLVGHSLGCVLIAHLGRLEALNVAGAFLAAPAEVDQEGPHCSLLKSFSPLPRRPLPFPTTLVASRNDPYMSIDRARTIASDWGSSFTDLGEAGHINVASGHGPWPQGQRLLDAFINRLDTNRAGHAPLYSGTSLKRDWREPGAA